MKPPVTQIVFLFFVLTCSYLGAQRIDSLKRLLNGSIHDSARCVLLNELIEAENNIDIWPKYNDELKNLVERKLKQEKKGTGLHAFYLKYLSGVLNNEGYYYRSKGDIQLALEYYLKSLNISEAIGDKKGTAGSLNNVGFIYYNLGDIPKALEYFQKSLKIMEGLKESQGIGTALNNIASVYDGQGDVGKAVEFYEKGLQVHMQNRDKMGAATTLNNIGLIYLNNREFSKALKYFHKSLSIQKEISDKSGFATSLNNIGLVYNKMGDKERALESYLRSSKIQEEISDKAGIIFSLNNIGGLYAEAGDYAKAEEYCKRSLAISKELGFPENIRNSSKILHELYARQGAFKDAYQMQSLYYFMRDSINNESNRKVSIKSQIKYAYDQKAVADSVKAMEEKKVTTAQLKQERTQRYSLYGGLALVGLFGGFMFNRFRVTSRQKKVIEIKSRETEIQKSIIEEHQKEIIDSITYAKRIQAAILPPQRMIKQFLGDAFVLYLPKDIVAGDFYWIHVNEDSASSNNAGLILFAAADCTGHGVPGAMVSVLCNNALNRSVKEFGLTDPGKILDKTREIIISEYEKSDEEVKDGMDISLCALDHKSMQLHWAGANNPLWIIRNGMLLEKKPNKQPIGKFADHQPFLTHSISLQQGDLIYIFTDGFADQFGG
ncbi:MAG: tetratricopeptide repeat protein, partial [Bacteroidia bacterium]